MRRAYSGIFWRCCTGVAVLRRSAVTRQRTYDDCGGHLLREKNVGAPWLKKTKVYMSLRNEDEKC